MTWINNSLCLFHASTKFFDLALDVPLFLFHFPSNYWLVYNNIIQKHIFGNCIFIFATMGITIYSYRNLQCDLFLVYCRIPFLKRCFVSQCIFQHWMLHYSCTVIHPVIGLFIIISFKNTYFRVILVNSLMGNGI